jgi:hypothetical protein
MRSGGIAPQFLTSAVDGGERLAPRFCPFTPGETVPGTHLIGGGWTPEPVWTQCRREKLIPLTGIEPRLSSP